ncbi:hypothetical protein HOG21_06600 [bacterium]|nr:hypothetical protein [bacterium]
MTISFAFFIFSSSHVLNVIINHQITIDQTANNHKYNAILSVQDFIFTQSHDSTSELPGSIREELSKQSSNAVQTSHSVSQSNSGSHCAYVLNIPKEIKLKSIISINIIFFIFLN